jgi:uncharacterized protein (TIGR02145 family)
MAENLSYKAEKGIWKYGKTNGDIYGYLYNWYSAKKACPAGWHLPNDAEWTKLVSFLGTKTTAGGKLKEKGTNHWLSPNTGATNETGFSALPGGYCNKTGTFSDLGKSGFWWSSTSTGTNFASDWSMYSQNTDISNYGDNMEIGVSVRCIKD